MTKIITVAFCFHCPYLREVENKTWECALRGKDPGGGEIPDDCPLDTSPQAVVETGFEEELTKPMEWISVSDRLPRKNDRCLTWDGKYMYISYYTDAGFDNDHVAALIAGFDNEEVKKITHWMLMPLPPTCKGN